MRNILVTIVIIISIIFYILEYKYFSFGADFYQTNNALVFILLGVFYFLGFALGRLFPWSVELEKEQEFTLESREKVDFQNIDDAGFYALKKDNLQLIEGIGPKVQEILYMNGIYTFKQLSECSVQKLQGILETAGERFQLCNPDTWPYQGELAAKKDWPKLKEYQDFLLRGVE